MAVLPQSIFVDAARGGACAQIVSAFHGATALLTSSVVGPDADGKKVDGLGRSRLEAGREG